MSLPACSPQNVESRSDKLKRVWTAQTVKENSSLVYTKGGAGNIRNYDSFRLDLSSPPAVSFTDYEGSTFTGQYQLQTDTRLVLKGLSPIPTSTSGTIEFTINAVNDNQLDLTRTTSSPKTGGSTNQYVLTNP
ncbi:hypothetical protein EQG79_09295 [Spirosoma sordidisoli]|uniref:Lipocalin-like domain-containing protein n=2 Tax=Spirosoma sordidisoli TaxID=2502893 RepID=A0A4Q2UQV8_9BACT|nr:hypothetical protein EQG79_09295 [Spirosoma sordidisoli]